MDTATVDTFLVATGRVYKTLEFGPTLSPFINYHSIATMAVEIGGHFAVFYAPNGSATVTVYWAE